MIPPGARLLLVKIVVLRKDIKQKLITSFPALSSRRYSWYFSGQLVSTVGSFLQSTAHVWLVYHITHSAMWVGVISGLGAIPVLILTPIGGVLVENISKKRLLISTQGASLILAVLFGLIIIAGHITPLLIALFALAGGLVSCFDNLATQTFVVEIVEKQHLPSAIGLNSTVFNAGKVLGPSIAGVLLSMMGAGVLFILNGLSFAAVLIALWFIKVEAMPKRAKQQSAAALKEGVVYATNHPLIAMILLTAGFSAIFSSSVATMLPIFAQDVFHVSASGLGMLLSASGLGALIGSVVVSSNFKKMSPPMRMVLGNFVFAVTMLLFTYTTNLPIILVLLTIAGVAMVLQFSTMYASMQQLVKAELRTRVSSLYVLLFIGLSPLGNIMIGSLASAHGVAFAVRFNTAMLFGYGMAVVLCRDVIRRKYLRYKKRTPTVAEPALAWATD